jgi:hypothetical protein
MKAKSFILLAILFAVFQNLVAFAANPWTDCGIGRMLFDDADDKGWASSSNLIWDLGTTAVTSATLSDGACTASRIETAKFIQVAYADLEEETVIGQGKFLDGLLLTAGCSGGNSQELKTKLTVKFLQQLSDVDYSSKDDQTKRMDYYQLLEETVIEVPQAQCTIS